MKNFPSASMGMSVCLHSLLDTYADVTRSYSFPESSHSDTTVTQDRSIWHVAIKAKTSTESTDY